MNNIPMEDIEQLLKHAVLKRETLKKADNTTVPAYHIALSGTSNYLIHTGISMCSIMKSNPEKNFEFHILLNDISSDDKKYMEKLVEKTGSGVNLYYINDQVFRQMLHKDGIAGYFYRFLIPMAIADEGVQRVLYIDGDVMCQGNLEPLMDIDLEGNIAACAEDSPTGKAEGLGRLHTADYFNSGMMLIDVPAWNKESLSQKAAAMAIERKQSGMRLESHDQDILNILLDKRFKNVSRKYNWTYNMSLRGLFQKQKQFIYDPEAVLIHFTGLVKPWRTWVQDLPAVQRYNSFRMQSPWKNIPLVGPLTHKDRHQAARHARRMKKWGMACKLYGKYFLCKLSKKK